MADKRVSTYEYSGEAGAKAPIFLEDFDHTFRGVQLEPIVTGVGYVQATLSSKQDVDDGHAGWVTWPAGSISAVTQDTIDPSVTAIRVYLTSGNLKLTVRLV
jgi:hypothetical protein